MIATNFRITRHSRERFLERTEKKYIHLSKCKTEGCHRCVDLIYNIRESLDKNRFSIDRTMLDRIGAAQEVRSYINNSQFMAYYYERYGYDHQPNFLVHNDLVFVLTPDKKADRNVVVTCLCAERHITGASHTKFKKALPSLQRLNYVVK